METDPSALTQTLEPFLAEVLERAGLDPSHYRTRAMQRRLAACLRKLRVSSVAQAQARLRAYPELWAELLGVVLIGVTGFFRDSSVFEHLRKQALPELLADRRALRVCSLGASHGLELYSVAMLLAETGALSASDLLGVDCRPQAIAAASAGVFSLEECAGLEPVWRERYLRRTSVGWEVDGALRASLRWEVGDVTTHRAPVPWDVILFRNVAIYFEGKRVTSMWKHLFDQLAPGGLLITGKAERPCSSLPLIRIGPSIYRKRA